ncbi:MAG: guanylate kinase [Lachnospiraceae bacterium]|nr:guanylate kinase [Lachnospiraceae bacterium]
MGKLYCLMGKSATGKDTIYKKLLEKAPQLRTITPYTTRPKRSGEQDGIEYYFTDEAGLNKLKEAGKVIECRTYNTVFGPWHFFTVDDGQIDLNDSSYLVIITPEACVKFLDYFGEDNVVPIYITLPDGELLSRALNRENSQETPHYDELCRRFLADLKDFSEENLREAHIDKRFTNWNADETVEEIINYINTIE